MTSARCYICPLLKELCFAGDIGADSPVRNMDEFVLPILKYCPNMDSVDVSDVLQALAENCRSLTFLDCHGCKKVTNAGILQVATCCLQLQKLCIGETKCTAYALSAGFPELRCLDTWWCHMDSEDVLKLIERGCPKLEQFTGQCSKSMPFRIDPNIEYMTRLLEQKMPPLKIIWM